MNTRLRRKPRWARELANTTIVETKNWRGDVIRRDRVPLSNAESARIFAANYRALDQEINLPWPPLSRHDTPTG